jgi:hypothetical protein
VKEIIKDKIILTQILRETLWDNIKNGQIIDGRVKETKQFGVLVSLDEETMNFPSGLKLALSTILNK